MRTALVGGDDPEASDLPVALASLESGDLEDGHIAPVVASSDTTQIWRDGYGNTPLRALAGTTTSMPHGGGNVGAWQRA